MRRSRRPFGALAVLSLIRAYQLAVRPLLAGWGACRFLPSCSDYATECVAIHGPLRGGWMAIGRIARCHPLGGSGLDLVPPANPVAADSPLTK